MGSARGRRNHIFISYRRDDTSGFAGRLHDSLRDHFGAGRIFRDIQTIEPGADFIRVIDEAVRASGVLLVVIGREWLSCTDSHGRRRLEDPNDFVRLEIATALEVNLVIIPVLVEAARVPAAAELPQPIARLARHNAVEISDSRWDSDVGRLITRLETVVGPPATLPGRGGCSRLYRGTRAKRIRTAIVSVVTLAATVLGLYWGLVPFFQRAPGPRPMTGDINLAVAEFSGVDRGGAPASSADARSLSQSFYDQLDTELQSVRQSGFDVKLRAPDETGRVQGATPEQRAVAAAAIAGRIRADVIVYATLDVDVPGQFTPEFYVSERKLTGAEEFLGQHQLGSTMQLLDDITTNAVARKELRDQLLGRTGALAEFILGLAYSTREEWRPASEHFQIAQATGNWPDSDGKEVLYLFIGNAAVKSGDLDTAARSYDRALALNPEYSRARIGRAEVMFQRAKGDCEAGHVDPVGLATSLDTFGSALSARFQPPLADTPTKVAFGEGRVYLCLSQALVADHYRDAERAFQQVSAEFSPRNQRVRRMASESHAFLGFGDLPAVGDADAVVRYRRAADEYQRAIDIMRDDDREHRKAFFWSMLGYIHGRLGEMALAERAYDRAISLAGDDAAARDRYEADRAHLQQPS